MEQENLKRAEKAPLSSDRIKVGATVSWVVYADIPSLRATMQGIIIAFPTSEAYQGTVKLQITDTDRKEYRRHIGEKVRRPIADLF